MTEFQLLTDNIYNRETVQALLHIFVGHFREMVAHFERFVGDFTEFVGHFAVRWTLSRNGCKLREIRWRLY